MKTVAGYRLLPRATVLPAAGALIALETFLAFAFLTGWAASIALPIALATTLTFFAAIAINLRRGERVPCGCFGDPEEYISGKSLGRVALLVLVVVAVLGARARGLEPIAINSLAGGVVEVSWYLFTSLVSASVFILAGMWVLSAPQLAYLKQAPAPGGPASATFAPAAPREVR